MGKNKNRVDLLAAGREKLQQFRQKKDKGNNSKSSGKAGKSGQDATSRTDTEAELKWQHAGEKGSSTDVSEDTIALAESNSKVDSVSSDTPTYTDEVLAKADVIEVASLAGTAEFPTEGSVVDETRLKQSADDVRDVDSGVSDEVGSSSLVLEDAKCNVQDDSDTMIPIENSAVSSISLPAYISSELEKQHGEEQVTDVGTIQEVGSSSGDQINYGMVTQLKGDNSLSSNEFGETSGEIMRADSGTTATEMETHIATQLSQTNDASNELDETDGDNKIADSGTTPTEMETHMATQPSQTNDCSLTGFSAHDAHEAQEWHNHSVVSGPSVESGLMSTVSSAVADQQRGGMASGFSCEEETNMLSISGGQGGFDAEGTQARCGFIDAERFSELETNEPGNSLGCKQLDLSSVLDGNVIELSQLAKILRILNEDEIRFLFMSRKPSLEKLRDTDKMTAHDSVVHEAFERLKEQLYVTSFSKDAFHLEISENQKLIDEISAVNASFVEAQGKNEIFAKEIVQCRNELQEVVSERDELQKKLHLSKAEVEDFAAEVNELQNKLEKAQGELSSLSSELFDCRNLVGAVQAENENLNGSFEMMTEEKRKLSEENGIILLENEKITGELAQAKDTLESLQTLLKDDRKQLEDKIDSVVGENRQLLTDLAVCKSTIESLESENKNLNEILTSVSEEREKLEEEKVSMAHQMEKVSKELMDHNDLVVNSQTEISKLNEHHTFLAEEKIKIEEEKENIYKKFENQSHELVEIKVLVAGLEEECKKAMGDLKEATFRVTQLTEENEFLNADLENHKSKIKEFDHKKPQLQKPISDFSSSEKKRKLDVYDDSSGFISLKRNLEGAQITIQNLENEIEGMHLHSTSLRSTDKVAAPGISRLIQAFESKTQADDQDPENSPSSENHATEDPYVRAKLVTENMRVLLKELIDDAESASDFCRVMRSKILVDAAGAYKKECKSLREHTDHVEEANIELMVLYEAIREHIRDSVGKQDELLTSRDALQKQEVVLRSENSQLREKLTCFQAKIDELQSQIDGICRDSAEMAASISDQARTLHAEVTDRESIREAEWNSVSAQVLQTVGVLDSTVNTFYTNSLAGGDSNLDVVGRVVASVEGARKVIESLHGRLEAAPRDRLETSEKNVVIFNTLYKLYNELSELVGRTSGNHPDKTENVVVDDKVLDLLHPDVFSTLLDQLKEVFGERLQLESENKQLQSELRSKARETDELEKTCLRSDSIMKLVEEIKQSVRLEGTEIGADEPASCLEFLIYLLVQKYKEACQGLSVSESHEMQLTDLQGHVEHLNSVVLQYENENLVFKQSLRSAEENVVALSSKIQEKVAELEQSEQRVSSLREKLSIAVTKGKGLISQRDNLKQSLAETSKELEKCSQELLSKDARLHELEEKLKIYSEAAERMEALESELSYIRNSATALRESFLLKDSVIQRIEEILEDLELPEHFHSRGIIEKIDWLAKSAGGNTLPPGDWDWRSSLEGASDAGFAGMDSLKEAMQPNPNSTDDLRRRYEELQNKFYGLAEQNEMLEESLRERNNVVQQWEEIMDRINVPSQLRSAEPEDKIQWLEDALSEAQNQCYALQQKIDNLETLCGSLTADVEGSQRRISELEMAFQQACMEKESLSKDLKTLSHDNDENLKKTADFKIRNENLQNDVNVLQEHKLQMEEDIRHTEDSIRRMQELVNDALQESCTDDVAHGQDGVEYLEELLGKLIEKYETHFSEKPVNVDSVDVHVTEKEEISHTSRDFEEDVVILSKKLEDSIEELASLKEEKDRYMLNNQSLLHEVEELETKRKELQALLGQEEQKSASLREKLNVAVRKGKSLVQQRDGMKQMIEELNVEVERLKSESKHTEKIIFEYVEQIKNLFATQERAQVIETENASLRDRLAETECNLQQKDGTWSNIMDALDEIDVGLGPNSVNPIEKLKGIGEYLHDLRTGLDSAEQESRKSKRAAELLLAELNEVQERNDGLQEELAKAVHELSELSREKDLAENAKYEALAHAEKLSYMHSEEKDRQLSEIMTLKAGVDSMRQDLFSLDRELEDVLSKDLEVLQYMDALMKSFSELGGTPDSRAPFPVSFPGGVISRKSENKVLMTEIGSLRERLYNHSRLLHEEASRLSEVVKNVHREYTSQKELYGSLKGDVKKLELLEKEKESELHVLRGNISLLYETCARTISEIENWKDQMSGNVLAAKTQGRSLMTQIHIEGGSSFCNDINVFDKEGIRGMCDKLLLVVRDLTRIQSELMEVGQGEMRSSIMNLQKELQKKDIQRDRICMELVNQIKEAETNAKNHLHDLQQARVQLHDSQRHLGVMTDKCNVLEQRMKELQDRETNSIDLQQKVNSLTDELAAKLQEAEALTEALEEQETEMEDLTNRVGGLEDELQQKNRELENLEASRAKALKKLSVTVSKFDELHYLSESLLSEVEKLQSQLQEKDGEISFLRQEVTRCTNDALAVTQMSKKRNSDEILDLLSWLDSLISRVQIHDAVSDDSKSQLVDEYKEVLQKRILDLTSELEKLRVVTQNSDMLLQEERSKVEELAQKEQYLKNSLREKESELVMLQGAGDSAKATKSTSEIVEVEQMTNKWASAGSIAPQVRSLRKTNNDQVAIAIDTDHSSDRLEDDDDKAHGFKSLTTSKIVPRFTRPVSDVVDGLWMSCDRALMRQPALRLGVILYWAVLHAMLATFVV